MEKKNSGNTIFLRCVSLRPLANRGILIRGCGCSKRLVESKRPIINYSGGTEISGGIVMGNPLKPLKPCAFSAPCPGIAADVLDENGKSLRNAVGELVIKAPWIGMTWGFWKDKQRYLDTYWSRWENIWVHGDFAAIDSDGLWYILGSSDDTIKIAGKRLGPAEVELILVKHESVVEAAAIGVPHEVKGSELVLFAVLKPGVDPERCTSSGIETNGRGRDGQASRAEIHPVCQRSAEDAQCKSDATDAPLGIFGTGARRYLFTCESAGGGRNQEGEIICHVIAVKLNDTI